MGPIAADGPAIQPVGTGVRFVEMSDIRAGVPVGKVDAGIVEAAVRMLRAIRSMPV
jgi:hypothetical protein